MRRRKRANQAEAEASQKDGPCGLLTDDGASSSAAGTICAPVGSRIRENPTYRVEAAPQLATAPAFMSGGRILTESNSNSSSQFNSNLRGVPGTAAQTAVQTPQRRRESFRENDFPHG